MKEDLASAEAVFQALSKVQIPECGFCKDMLNLYMRLGLTEKAKDFIFQIRKIQVEFDEELLKTVMKFFCIEGMVRDAVQLIREFSASKTFEDSVFTQTFSVAIQGNDRFNATEIASKPLDQQGAMAFELALILFIADGSTMKAEETLKLLLNSANGLSVASQLIRKFTKEGDISKAENLYKLLMKLGREPEDVASASLINFYGKQKNLKEALNVFASVADSSRTRSFLYSSIIDSYNRCDKQEEAYMFYKEEMKKGHVLGPVAISMLVNGLSDCGRYTEAKDIIHNSLRANVELDTVAYNTFIKAMLEAGKLRLASRIYEHMLSLGIPPSIHTYNTMISVYGRGKNLDKAVEAFDTAQKMGISLDEKAYTNLICYYGKAGKYDEASNLFVRMQEAGIKPGQVSCNIMMNIYAAAGLYQEAEVLMQSMRSSGCKPDSLTYLALIRAYTRWADCSEAENAIDSMQKEGIPPSCAHFNVLLSGFAKGGLIEVERIYNNLMNVGLQPDLESKTIMLRCYMDYGHVEEGISFFERISKSVKPDRFIMSAAVHLYRSASLELKAEGVLRSMKSLGLPFLENLEVGSRLKAD